mmetsp:Transcript_28992/g.87703  ORF Transcript_28992/g.87703 Transcript_28992/m.87703 type:complete len:211 (+) Transcript_28992:829-1461(+)
MGMSARATDAMTMLTPLPNLPAKNRRRPCMVEPSSAIPAENKATYFLPNCGLTNLSPTMPLTNGMAKAKPTVRKDSSHTLASSHTDAAPTRSPHRRRSLAAWAATGFVTASPCTGDVPTAAATIEASASGRPMPNVAVMPTPASCKTKALTFTRHSVPRDQKPNTAASPEVFDSRGSPDALAMRCADCPRNVPPAVYTKPAPKPQHTAPA